MKCSQVRQTLRYEEGLLPPGQRTAFERHVAGCARCAALLGELRAIGRGLRPDVGELDDAGLVDDVLTLIRLGQAEPPKMASARRPVALLQRWGLAAAAGLLLAGLTVGLWWWTAEGGASPSTEGFVRRSGGAAAQDRWVSIDVFRATERGAQPVGRALRPGDALAFAYDKRAASGYDQLMVLAVDDGGRVFWYYPAYQDERQNPVSLAVADTRGPVALPDEIQHAYRPGALRVFAVFSKQPLTVRQVEAIVAEDLHAHGTVRSLERLSIEQSGQHSVLLFVDEEE